MAKRVAIIVGGVVVAIVVVAIAVVFTLLNSGKHNLLHPEGLSLDSLKVYSGATSTDGGRTVTYNGATYKLNEDVIPICIMGRDKTLQAPEEGFNGQADAIMVLTFNVKNNDINGISIPRDSMVGSSEGFRKVFEGTPYNTDKMQLCLAYSYGKNDEQSSEFMLDGVSELLYGIPVKYYCTLDAGGLGELADLAGGVTLEAIYALPPTDYSTDMPIEAGHTVTLRGGDALRYVLYRDESRFASALERLERQRQFVAALGKELSTQLKGNPTMILGISGILQKYGTTNLGIGEIGYLASVAAQANMDDVDTTRLLGETIKNPESEWEQYLVDEPTTYQTVLDAFYTRIN